MKALRSSPRKKKKTEENTQHGVGEGHGPGWEDAECREHTWVEEVPLVNLEQKVEGGQGAGHKKECSRNRELFNERGLWVYV